MVKTVACALTPEQVEHGTLGENLDKAVTLNRNDVLQVGTNRRTPRSRHRPGNDRGHVPAGPRAAAGQGAESGSQNPGRRIDRDLRVHVRIARVDPEAILPGCAPSGFTLRLRSRRGPSSSKTSLIRLRARPDPREGLG